MSRAKQGGGKKRKGGGLSDEQVDELREAFNLFDADGSGSIDMKEISKAMKVMGIKISKEELTKMISDVDSSGDGDIDFSEFLQMMTGKMGEKDSREDVVKVFKLFDDDNTGKITLRNLRRVSQELGETIDDDELMDMLMQADRDGDGELDVDEFYRIVKKKGNFLEDMSSDDDF